MKALVLQRVLLRFNSIVPSLLTSMWSIDGFLSGPDDECGYVKCSVTFLPVSNSLLETRMLTSK